MDYNPSQDHHQGRRAEQTEAASVGTDVSKEIELMESNIRSLEDAVKRLDALPQEAFTKDHQVALTKLQGRLFELSK